MNCARCEEVIVGALSTGKGWERARLHRDIDDLITGIRGSCYFCLRLFENIPQFHDIASIEVTRPKFYSVLIDDAGSLQTLRIYCSHGTSLHLDIYEDQDGPEVSSNTGSQQSWDYVTSRLRNCEENHDKCDTTPGWAPSRLVEVIEANGSTRFRIISTLNDWDGSPFVTLSHRWGVSDEALRLTSKTIDEYEQEIPKHLMPRKFIDASEVAKRLEIKYMWIDSLCIKQDSIEDWDRESSKMDLIYRNGFCNIAASSATNHNEGLFFERNPSSFAPHRVHLHGGKGSVIVPKKWPFKDLEYTCINLRGWVLQERMLACRNISFTRELIFFECAEEFSCEVADSSKPRTRLQESSRGFRYGFQDSPTNQPRGLDSLRTLSQTHPHDMWRRLVTVYSSTQLTEPSDRLVALTGIAKVFKETIQSQYLAGLWETDLVRHLAWVSLSAVYDSDAALSEYIAPSWSWASQSSPISYPNNLYKIDEFVEVLETVAVPMRENPFGSVRDGRIKLRGWVLPLLSAHQDPGTKARRRPRSPNDRPISNLRLLLDNKFERFGVGGAAYADAKHLALLDLHRDSTAKEYYLLPLLGYATHINGRYLISCLLLVAVTPSWGVYQRVGMYDLNITRVNTRAGNKAHQDCDDEELPFGMRSKTDRVYNRLTAIAKDSAHYEVPSHERTADGRYTITLV